MNYKYTNKDWTSFILIIDNYSRSLSIVFDESKYSIGRDQIEGIHLKGKILHKINRFLNEGEYMVQSTEENINFIASMINDELKRYQKE